MRKIWVPVPWERWTPTGSTCCIRCCCLAVFACSGPFGVTIKNPLNHLNYHFFNELYDHGGYVTAIIMNSDNSPCNQINHVLMLPFVVNLQGVSKKRCKQNTAGAAVYEQIGPTKFNFGWDFWGLYHHYLSNFFLDILHHLITATD